MRKFVTAFLLSILGIGLLLPTTALAATVIPENGKSVYPATSSNNTLSIKSVAVFPDYVTTGDWLITAEIDNTKAPYANNGTASRYFVVYLKDTDNTTVIAATPLKFWQDAPVSIYLAPTVVSGLTYGAAYRLQVIGTYTTPPSDNYSLSANNWYGNDKTLLDDWVISTAVSMDIYYGYVGTAQDLLSYTTQQGVTLSNTGGAYFLGAIPNLSNIRPSLFLVPGKAPINSPPAESNTYDAANDWTAKVGSKIVGDMNTFGNVFGVTSKQWAGITLLLVLGAMCVVTLQGVGTGIGLAIFAVPLIYVAGYLGFISITVSLMIAGIFLFLFARRYWLSST
jgi:hypothetical protein